MLVDKEKIRHFIKQYMPSDFIFRKLQHLQTTPNYLISETITCIYMPKLKNVYETALKVDYDNSFIYKIYDLLMTLIYIPIMSFLIFSNWMVNNYLLLLFIERVCFWILYIVLISEIVIFVKALIEIF